MRPGSRLLLLDAVDPVLDVGIQFALHTDESLGWSLAIRIRGHFQRRILEADAVGQIQDAFLVGFVCSALGFESIGRQSQIESLAVEFMERARDGGLIRQPFVLFLLRGRIVSLITLSHEGVP